MKEEKVQDLVTENLKVRVVLNESTTAGEKSAAAEESGGVSTASGGGPAVAKKATTSDRSRVQYEEYTYHYGRIFAAGATVVGLLGVLIYVAVQSVISSQPESGREPIDDFLASEGVMEQLVKPTPSVTKPVSTPSISSEGVSVSKPVELRSQEADSDPAAVVSESVSKSVTSTTQPAVATAPVESQHLKPQASQLQTPESLDPVSADQQRQDAPSNVSVQVQPSNSNAAPLPNPVPVESIKQATIAKPATNLKQETGVETSQPESLKEESSKESSNAFELPAAPAQQPATASAESIGPGSESASVVTDTNTAAKVAKVALVPSPNGKVNADSQDSRATIETFSADVASVQMSGQISGREPVGYLSRTIDLGTPPFQTVYIFSSLTDRRGERVTYQWFRNGNLQAEVPVLVRGNDRWTSYSSKNINGQMVGDWEVRLVDSEGNSLLKGEFHVVR